MAGILPFVVFHTHPSNEKFREFHFEKGIQYLIMIPVILEGLPSKARLSTINSPSLNWKLGSIVYAKMGTTLIASAEGGGAVIVIGAKHK